MSLFFWLSHAMALEEWSLPKMNDEDSADKVAQIAAGSDGLVLKGNSHILKEICIEGRFDRKKLQEELKNAGFVLAEKRKAKRCPTVPKIWKGVEGDFAVVSTKKRFSMKKKWVEGKYTIFDFGAAWCPPCHSNAKILKKLLRERTDLAVRAIDLEGKPENGFYLPVAYQYLSKVSAIPWFVLFCKDGKKCYEGGDVQELITILE